MQCIAYCQVYTVINSHLMGEKIFPGIFYNIPHPYYFFHPREIPIDSLYYSISIILYVIYQKGI